MRELSERQLKLGGAAAAVVGAWLLRRHVREREAIDFAGRVVLITGGSRGLGLELARAFAKQGARLALVARNEDELFRAQDDLAARGARVFVVTADVRDRHDVEHAVQKVVTHYGRLDVLVNNAGVIAVGPAEHMTIEDYEQAMAVHYWGPLHAILAALPHLRRAPGARIVNIASIGGKIAVPHLAPYSGSKFALVGLSDALRAELAPEGIRVTTVSPGLIRTGSPINATFKGRHHDEFAWFTISDSLPVVSVSSRRAAREVLEACRRGAASLVIGSPARLAVALQGVAPGLVAAATAIAARLLPSPDPNRSVQGRLGWESRSRWAPSLLTRLGEEAAERNNELHPALPIPARR
jgi:NAD(P)-dependent dehydrogenase (short-subunit alcohol dehydrogenase family)